MTTSPARRLTAGAILATVGGLLGATLVAAPASALGFVVDNTTSAGDGSLPAAVALANATPGANVITFNLPPNTIITLTEPIPTITEDLLIDGPGSSQLLVNTDLGADGIVVQGDAVNLQLDGISLDTTDVAATTSGIWLDEGNLTATDVFVNGYPNHGLEATDANVTATDSVFSDNGEGGIYWIGGADAGLDSLSLTRVDANNNTVGITAIAVQPSDALSFTDTEARSNSFEGVSIFGEPATVTFTGGQYWQNGTGVDVEVANSGLVRFIGTEINENDGGGVVADLANNSPLGFTDSYIHENGLVTPVAGGGISAELDDTAIILENTDVTGNEGTDGGGVYLGTLIGASALNLSDSDISNNTATGDGGGIYVGSTGGTLTSVAGISIRSSTITGNTAQGSGGGILIDVYGNGVYFSDGGLTIESSTIDDNHATNGDGGGIRINEFSNVDASDQNIITVLDSTLSNNTASNGFGGAFSFDKNGTTLPDPSELVFVNTTISGNDADAGGAGHIIGSAGATVEMALLMDFVTITDNSNALWLDDTSIDFDLSNSIVSGNGSQDINYTPTDPALFTARYSNVGNGGVSLAPTLAAGPGNQVGADPHLGPLADNGGPTLTHLPLAGSPVFDAADPTFVAGDFPEFDQRFEPRVLGGRADMGAVESPKPLAATGAELNLMLPLGALLLLLSGAALVATRRMSAP